MSARRRLLLSTLTLLAAGMTTACQSTEPYDYGPYLDHMPHSILVLPPTNESVEPMASYNYLSTVTAPIAERGYYVFPVALVDQMMKENGLPTPDEMRTADLAKLRQVIGADAVLYLHVKDWGTSYQVIQSATTVSVEGRLVDTRSGATLWEGSHAAYHSSSQGQSNPIAMLVGAVVSQIVSTESDHAHDIAGPAAVQWLWAEGRGLLLGPRHPGFRKQMDSMRRAPAP